MPFLAGLAAAFVLVLVVTIQYGDIADRRWRAVLWEPLVAGAAIIGMGEALTTVAGAAGYIVGSTVACAVALWYRRRGA